MIGNLQIVSLFFGVIYLAVIGLVVWLVVSALIGIRRGVEDIANTLRRMEARGQTPPPNHY